MSYGSARPMLAALISDRSPPSTRCTILASQADAACPGEYSCTTNGEMNGCPFLGSSSAWLNHRLAVFPDGSSAQRMAVLTHKSKVAEPQMATLRLSQEAEIAAL